MVGLRMVAGVLLVVGSVGAACAQNADKPAYLNPNLPAEQRAADLVHRMTLEEKASQLVNQARAIPRLGVPAYDWWSEALHGVANTGGVTSFPEPIGLAATFDAPGVHEMAVATSTEARVVHDKAVEANGDTPIFRGLDFWAPNLNIFRDPRWGRGQETYGEDPFLTARMGVAYVTGMQGDDPRYYRVISTPKHFVVHSGPEPTRHFADVDVSRHDELDTYLPAFRAAVTEGKADSVMCAYNAINGQPACANEFTLQDQLRGKWGFQGYVVSDCGAVRDIFEGHRYEPTQAQASAISLQRGMDNECVDFRAKVLDDHDYKPYVDAVKAGYLKESEIDTAVIRLFTARMKLGMFDPPDMVPYAKTDPSELDSAAHRALALKLANEAMVLLKNDGALPLKTVRSEDARRWSAGRADACAAGQLQRDSIAHGVDSGGTEEGVRRRHDHLHGGNRIPEQGGCAGSERFPDGGWKAGSKGDLSEREHRELRQRADLCDAAADDTHGAGHRHCGATDTGRCGTCRSADREVGDDAHRQRAG